MSKCCPTLEMRLGSGKVGGRGTPADILLRWVGGGGVGGEGAVGRGAGSLNDVEVLPHLADRMDILGTHVCVC